MKKLLPLGFIVLMLSMSACQSAPEATAEEATSTAQLRNTLWKLIELNGRPVRTAEGQRMASLTLMSTAQIVTACNGGSAGYTVEGASIKFGMSMSTKMACEPEPTQQEAAFFNVIEKANRYVIKGETLELYNADNKLLARFHSEYLK